MSQQSTSSMTKAPTKIDDSINYKFEEIVAEYQSSQETIKSSNDNEMKSINGDMNHVDDEVSNVTNNKQPDQMIEFLCLIGRLKTLPRRGWILNNRCIPNPEPVAGHMYRMAIMSMLIDDESTKLDINKMVKLSLIHDMAECIVGDITPMDDISVNEKHRNELHSMQKLVSLLPQKQSQRLYDLYKEYEAHESPESLLVKELDRFDICLQAFQYERQEYFNNEKRIIRFDEFFNIALDNIRNPLLRNMVERIIAERDRFWNEEILQSKQNDIDVKIMKANQHLFENKCNNEINHNNYHEEEMKMIDNDCNNNN